MSITTNVYFDNQDDFTQNDNISIIDKARLKLINGIKEFIEDFSNGVGFYFQDGTKAGIGEGSLVQIDQRPEDAILGCKFDTKELNWGEDGLSLTGTLLGSASIDNENKKLLCPYGSNGEYWYGTQIGALSKHFVAKFKYTPGYSTTPPENVNLFSLSPTDKIVIFHSPVASTLRITAPGLSAVVFDTWEPLADQEYIFEVHSDSGYVSLYVDNVQIGDQKYISGYVGYSNNYLYLGADPNSYNVAYGKFTDLILYITATQTPVYSIPNAAYLETWVSIPIMQKTGDGKIVIFNTLSVSEGTEPRYTIEIDQSGNYLYWNGSAWSVSDTTYAQSNNLVVFNLNCASLPISGATYFRIRVHFCDSNTQDGCAYIVANLTVQDYSLNNAYIDMVKWIYNEGLYSFICDRTITGSDNLRYILFKNEIMYWWNGSIWDISDGTYLQSNTEAEVSANISTFTALPIKTKIRVFFHSETGETTPEIISITMQINFYGNEEDEISVCIVWGWSKKLDQTPDTTSFTITLNKDHVMYKNTTFDKLTITVTPNSEGYWEVTLIENENMEDGSFYNFNFANRTYSKKVRNVLTEAFSRLEAA